MAWLNRWAASMRSGGLSICGRPGRPAGHDDVWQCGWEQHRDPCHLSEDAASFCEQVHNVGLLIKLNHKESSEF